MYIILLLKKVCLKLVNSWEKYNNPIIQIHDYDGNVYKHNNQPGAWKWKEYLSRLRIVIEYNSVRFSILLIFYVFILLSIYIDANLLFCFIYFIQNINANLIYTCS